MIYSRTFKPAPSMCCSACVFGQGEHEPWCGKRGVTVTAHTDSPAVNEAVKRTLEWQAGFNKFEEHLMEEGHKNNVKILSEWMWGKIPVKVDPTMGPGTVRIEQDGKTVGTIVNVGLRTAHCNRCGKDLQVGEVDTHHSCRELDEQIRRDFSNGQITMQRLAEKYPEQLVYSGGVNQKEKETRECPRHPQSPMVMEGTQWRCVVCSASQHAADVFRDRFQSTPQWEGTAEGHPLHRR